MSLFTDLLADQSGDTVYIYDLYPYDIANEAVVTDPIRLTNKWYGRTDSAVTQYCPSLVDGRFSITRRLFKGNTIAREAESSYSDIKIENPAGDLDDWETLYEFAGRRIVIRYGRPNWPLSEFGTIFDGVMDGRPRFGIKDIQISVRDKRYLIDKEPQLEVYTGGIDGVQFDYNGGTSSGYAGLTNVTTNAPNLNITGPMLMTWLMRVNGTADQSSAQHIINPAWGETIRPYSVVLVDADTLDQAYLRINYSHSSGTSVNYNMSAKIKHDKWYSCMVRVDSDDTWYAAVRDTESGTTIGGQVFWEELGTSPSARDGLSGTADLRVGNLDVEIRELRIYDDEGWASDDTDAQGFLKWKRGAERIGSAATVLEDGGWGGGATRGDLVSYWRFDEGTGTTVGDSHANAYDLTLSGNYSWGSPLQGYEELAGKRKPISLGQFRRVDPPWVDPGLLIMQIHHQEINAVTNVWENGGDITPSNKGGSWTAGGDQNAPSNTNNAPDLATFLSSAPAIGEYTVFLDLGYVRLGSSPSGAIRVSARGDVPAGSGIYSDRLHLLIRKLLEEYSDLTYPDDFDTTSLTDLNTAVGSTPHGYFIDGDDNFTVQKVLNDLCIATRTYSFWNREGKIEFGQFDEPASTPDWYIRRGDIKLNGIKPVKLKSPAWRGRFGWSRTFDTITDVATNWGTDFQRELFTNLYRWITIEEPSIRVVYNDSEEIDDVESYVIGGPAMQEWADEWMRVYGSPGRRMFEIELNSMPGLVEIGDTVNITYPRWGLDDGVNFVVVEWSDGATNKMRVWG